MAKSHNEHILNEEENIHFQINQIRDICMTKFAKKNGNVFKKTDDVSSPVAVKVKESITNVNTIPKIPKIKIHQMEQSLDPEYKNDPF